MGYDWENEKRLLDAMEWSSNKVLFSNLVKQVMDEFAALGKAALARALNQCDVKKAGVVPCNILYFPHTDHRCQMVQRLEKVYQDVSKHCNAAWKSNFGGKINQLVVNNKNKKGAACPAVDWL
jgi:hypothetical protein